MRHTSIYFSALGLAGRPDSKRVIIARQPKGDPRPSLFTLDVETREIKLLVSRPPDLYLDSQLTYSPDGKSFVFVRHRGVQHSGTLHRSRRRRAEAVEPPRSFLRRSNVDSR